MKNKLPLGDKTTHVVASRPFSGCIVSERLSSHRLVEEDEETVKFIIQFSLLISLIPLTPYTKVKSDKMKTTKH